MLVAADARQTILQHLPRGAVGMEIGVWRGDFSANILRLARPTRLYLVDPWAVTPSQTHRKSWYSRDNVTQEKLDQLHDLVRSRFASEIEAEQVVVRRARSVEVMAELPAGLLDFVYVDGDHAFAGVQNDLAGAFRAVKTGGLICGDDYSLGSWWGDGVVRGVHEFLAKHPVIVEFIIGKQFMLRKMREAV